VWPAMARAQQSAMPVIGYLDAGSLETRREYVAAIHRGLSENSYFEGRNLAVEYRWAEDRLDRLPALAADLVRHQVAVIFATPTPSAVAAKAATKSIPIVFTTGADPVEIGLVASLNRPGGTLTGMANLTTAVAAKRLALLHEFSKGRRRLAPRRDATRSHAPQAAVGWRRTRQPRHTEPVVLRLHRSRAGVDGRRFRVLPSRCRRRSTSPSSLRPRAGPRSIA
jgi:hypothetical protein